MFWHWIGGLPLLFNVLRLKWSTPFVRITSKRLVALFDGKIAQWDLCLLHNTWNAISLNRALSSNAPCVTPVYIQWPSTTVNPWHSLAHFALSHLGCGKAGCFRKTLFLTRQSSALRSVWKNPKGFLISTKFRGSSSLFSFDHFYIVDFHSALTLQVSVSKSKVWVKIYNVKWSKLKRLEDPLNLVEIKNPFGFFQTNLMADDWWVPPI